jgi:hypothetical protein
LRNALELLRRRRKKCRRLHHDGSTVFAVGKMTLDLGKRVGGEQTIGVLREALGVRMPQVV